jgi:hypothetical protein
MSKPTKARQLLEKSINGAISAIEIYNKPDFKYREELFSELMVNAWELLLKSKVLEDNNSLLSMIYVKEYIVGKSGKKTKRWKYSENRSSNKKTIDIFEALKRIDESGIKLSPTFKQNIEVLVEIRDNAVHFYNQDQYFSKKVQEVGLATLKSYITYVNEWFCYDLSQYNFYLMPMSLFHEFEMESFSINNRDKQQQNLLKYIATAEDTAKADTSHAVTLSLETKLVKSKESGIEAFRLTNDPNAPAVQLKEEEMRDRYKWDYGKLCSELKSKYSNFKRDSVFSGIMKDIKENPKFCWQRAYNPDKPSSGFKNYFDPNIFNEFDKYYIRKATHEAKI